MSIEARNITKKFGEFTALKNVDLEVRAGELVSLLGPSGSGKTTLLRIIAGLEFPDAGHVLFDGKDISNRSARERNVGFVFQHYALFRHMTVEENIGFGLRVRPRPVRPSDEEIRARIHALLQLVQLEDHAARYPSQLSGGQRQRVALARALAVEPEIMLMDEPFGSLDAKVRIELRRWLRRLHDEFHITSVFVTHDQEEALEVSDRVVVMNEGRIEQVGSPEDVYRQPANTFVFDFLGNVNLFRGRLEPEKPGAGESASDAGSHSKQSIVFLRSRSLPISQESQKGLHHRVTIQQIRLIGTVAKIEAIGEQGDSVHIEVSQDRFQELQWKNGDEVFLRPGDTEALKS